MRIIAWLSPRFDGEDVFSELIPELKEQNQSLHDLGNGYCFLTLPLVLKKDFPHSEKKPISSSQIGQFEKEQAHYFMKRLTREAFSLSLEKECVFSSSIPALLSAEYQRKYHFRVEFGLDCADMIHEDGSMELYVDPAGLPLEKPYHCDELDNFETVDGTEGETLERGRSRQWSFQFPVNRIFLDSGKTVHIQEIFLVPSYETGTARLTLSTRFSIPYKQQSKLALPDEMVIPVGRTYKMLERFAYEKISRMKMQK